MAWKNVKKFAYRYFKTWNHAWNWDNDHKKKLKLPKKYFQIWLFDKNLSEKKIQALHKVMNQIIIGISSLFVKLPWPGDCEGTFRFSSQDATCPSVYHTRRRLHTVPFNDWWTSNRKTVNTNFYSLLFNPTGNWTGVHRFSSRRSSHSIANPNI